MKPILKNLTGLHAHIAADVWPAGGLLRCGECDQVQPFTTQDAANYLASGWPKHCERTMTVATAVTQETS